MSDDENLKIAKEYISRLSAGAGADELDTYFCADIVQEEFPNRLMPNGATRDRQGLRDARLRGKALLKEEHFELLNTVASHQSVAMELVWTGIVREAAGSFAAGQKLRARFAIFMEFRDGRIVRQRNYDCFDPW